MRLVSMLCAGLRTRAPLDHQHGVEVLLKTETGVAVVAKPGGVPCHKSEYVGRGRGEPAPLLQQARDTLGERVNLVHRLDRGASGCVLAVCASTATDAAAATRELHEALRQSVKTYACVVRGCGVYRDGKNLRLEGWFDMDRPVNDHRKLEKKNATTSFRFLSSANEDQPDRCSLVLARPRTGRWHQIRKHLATGLSHPIVGDSTHGNSQTNRHWRQSRGLPGARLLLHLARLQMPPTSLCPEGLDVACPLPSDFQRLLHGLPDLVADGRAPFYAETGLSLLDE